MRGSVTKQDNGTWAVVYDAGDQPRHECTACDWCEWGEGAPAPEECRTCGAAVTTVLRRRQHRKRGFERKTGPGGAEEWLTKQIRAVQRGTHIDPTTLTLREYLEGRWLPAKRADVTPNTFKKYEEVSRIHIVPVLGEVPLQKLDTMRIKGWVGGYVDSDLSAKSRRHLYYTLNNALNDARDLGLIGRNPMDPLTAPKKTTRDMQVWSAAQIRAFLAAQEATRLYPIWRLICTTGMRRGEVCGLRWSDVDWDARTISIDWAVARVGSMHVYKRPKHHPRARDSASRRKLKLDADTLAALRDWCKQQLEERLAAGEAWVEDLSGWFEYVDAKPSSVDLVFRMPDGRAMRPSYLTSTFPALAVRTGLPRIRLHDLRHSYATMMLLSGVHVKIVSERLGHTNIGMTLDLYSWVLPAQDAQAAEEGAAILDGPGEETATYLRRCRDCGTVDTGRRYATATAAVTDDAWRCRCSNTDAAIIEEDGHITGLDLGEGEEAEIS